MTDAIRSTSVYFTGERLKAFESGRIGGYLVVFTGPNDRDSYNEYFTGATDFGLNWYRDQPILYHHGKNDVMVTRIGVITSLVPDEYGLYADAQLDINHEDPSIRAYARQAYDQVNAGKLFWSSGSAEHLVRLTDDGQITQWPVVEGSLTPKPAEERGRTYVEVLRAAMRTMLDEESKDAHTIGISAKEPPAAKEPSLFRSSPRRFTMSKNAAKMDMATVMTVLDGSTLDPEQKWALATALAAADTGMGEMEVEETTLADEPLVPQEAPPIPPVEPMAAARTQMSPKEFAASVLQQMRTAPANTPLPAGGGENPTVKSPLNAIQMRTPYHDLSPVDMSYMYELRSGAARHGKMNAPDIKFVREMHAKTKTALTYEASASAMKMDVRDANRIMAIRDNELDNTASTGQILEWIPTIWSAELWRRVRLENEVAKNFRTIDMPSDPYNLPIESTDPTVSLVPETTNEAQLTLASSANPIPDSVLGSGKVVLDAKKLALRVGFSSEAEEDSIIPFIPQLREQGIRAMANAVDNVILNGDTTTTASTNINDIAGTPAATDKFLIFNGLLKNALVTGAATQSTNASNSAPTLAMIRLLRSKLYSTLNAYGLRPDDLVMFVDPYTWFKMLSIDEINSWLNNGRNATVNNGMLPNIDGIPVWPSQEMGLANSAGKIDLDVTTNNTYGRIVMAAKTGWTIGYRRQVTTNVDYLSYYDSYQMTATLRVALINKDGYASSAAFGINVG